MYEVLQYTHVLVFFLLLCAAPTWRFCALMLMVSAGLYLFMQPQMDLWNDRQEITSYIVRAMIDSIIAFSIARHGGKVAQGQAVLLIIAVLFHLAGAIEYYTTSYVVFSSYGSATNTINVLQLVLALGGVKEAGKYIKHRMDSYFYSPVHSLRDNSFPRKKL